MIREIQPGDSLREIDEILSQIEKLTDIVCRDYTRCYSLTSQTCWHIHDTINNLRQKYNADLKLPIYGSRMGEVRMTANEMIRYVCKEFIKRKEKTNMNYLVTKFDDRALMSSIEENAVKYNRKVVLSMSKKTANEIEKKSTAPFFTPYDSIKIQGGYLAIYYGYTVLEDNSLELGEIKQYIEV